MPGAGRDRRSRDSTGTGYVPSALNLKITENKDPKSVLSDRVWSRQNTVWLAVVMAETAPFKLGEFDEKSPEFARLKEDEAANILVCKLKDFLDNILFRKKRLKIPSGHHAYIKFRINVDLSRTALQLQVGPSATLDPSNRERYIRNTKIHMARVEITVGNDHLIRARRLELLDMVIYDFPLGTFDPNMIEYRQVKEIVDKILNLLRRCWVLSQFPTRCL